MATTDMGQKLGGGGCAHCPGGSWVPIEDKVACADAYLHIKWNLSPSAIWPQRTLVENWGAVPL